MIESFLLTIRISKDCHKENENFIIIVSVLKDKTFSAEKWFIIMCL